MAAEIIPGQYAESLARIWQEFLAPLFDGGVHVLCGLSQKFPVAQLGFGATDVDVVTPIAGLAITVLLEDNWGLRGRVWAKDSQGSPGADVLSEAAFWFYFRAKVGPAEEAAGLGNARYLSRRGYDLFSGLIIDPMYAAQLGGHGIFDLELGQGRSEPVADYATWIVRVRGRVGYEF